MDVSAVVSHILLSGGVLLVLIASIGLQRFDSVFARIHPATKATTLGIVLLALGAAARMPEAGDVVKLMLVAVLQMLTAPIAAHMVARAAYHTGGGHGSTMRIDELADALARDDGQG